MDGKLIRVPWYRSSLLDFASVPSQPTTAASEVEVSFLTPSSRPCFKLKTPSRANRPPASPNTPGFMIVRFNHNGNDTHGYEMIDFRETAPAAANETMYAADGSGATLSTVGGLAAGVPGELRGWELLHQRHGKMPW